MRNGVRNINAPNVQGDGSPYYLARIGDEFLKASNSYRPDNILPFVRFYLLGVCVELGMKAFLLSNNNTAGRRKANKSLGHDLERIYEEYESLGGERLSELQLKSLQKLNTYFKSKALEYSSPELWSTMLSGRAELPDIGEIHGIAEVITEGSRRESHFINSVTVS
jgi:hypothetical protein